MAFWPEPQHPTARIPHACDMCGRTIQPGEQYKRAAGLDAGTAWTWKECTHCQALLQVHPEILDWIDVGYNADSVTEWEPRTFEGMLRQSRFRRGWRHGNGDLAAIPAKAAA